MPVISERRRFLPVFLVLTAIALAGFSPAPERIGVENPAVAADTVPDVTRHRICIASTRTPSDAPGVFLSTGRAAELNLALVEVTIPPPHVVGRIERPGRLPPDPRTEFTVVNPVFYGGDAAMISAHNRELASRPRGERKLLPFVHGCNNTASDAVLRQAQCVVDTGFQGVPILLTLASAASTPRHVYDLNSALVARGKIKELADIMAGTRAESSDVFAHSMGTLLTMEGLLDLQQAGTLGRRGTINHIMPASPDIDLFRTRLAQLSPAIRKKIYLLVSADDKAPRASSIIAGGVPRVGAANTEELENLGVAVIDLSEIEDSSSGSHSKFAGSPEGVRLIGAGLNSAGTFDLADTPGLGQLLVSTPISILGN